MTKTYEERAAPTHVAFIMDGNARWASTRGLSIIAGHQQGVKTVRKVIEKSINLGVSYLTLYAFSSENWKRPKEWVDDLMGLFKFYLKSELATLHKQGISLRFLGDRSSLAKNLVDMMEHATTLTKDNTNLVVNIALSYGSRQEILSACKQLIDHSKEGKISSEELTEDVFERYLDTSSCPAPDLLIRTSGEQRLSNFLLWQMAYTEFMFLECYWPDFTEIQYEECIDHYTRRERRFGTTNYA